MVHLAADNSMSDEKPNGQGKENRLISIIFQVFLIIFSILAETGNDVENVKGSPRSYTLNEAIQETSEYSNIVYCRSM